MVKRLSIDDLQIRKTNFLPSDLRLVPEHPKDVRVKPDAQVTLTQLFGQSDDSGHYIGAFDWNALKAVSYGSGFQEYITKSGTAPAAFSDTHELSSGDNVYHRWDITVAVQPAEIRFYQDRLASWGDAIPLPIGTSSIDFSSTKCQIKYASASGTTYTMIGYR